MKGKRLLILGAAFALAVGAVAGAVSQKEAKAVHADETVNYDFTNIDGFASWTTSYLQHDVEYDEGTVTFASANRQNSTIIDRPVTKGQPVSFVLDGNYQITSATFVCQQWTNKAQTITMHYSTDGGSTYTSTGVTSTNFTISNSSFDAGTNAIKFTFSNASNQVGISSLSITYGPRGNTQIPSFSLDKTSVELVLGGDSTTVKATPNEYVAANATYSWSRTSGDDCVTLIDTDTDTVTIAPKGNATSASCVITASVTDCESKTISVTVKKPFTVAEARAEIDSNTTVSGAYVKGIIYQIDSFNSTYNSITYWISDDGESTNPLEVYGGKGLNNADFSSTDDLQIGATVIVYGNLKNYKGTYEFEQNNYIVSYTQPAEVPAEEITLDKNTLTVEAGYTRKLSYTLHPAGSIGAVTWHTLNSAIATVENGIVTGVAPGTTTITATCDELTPVSCSVTVISAMNYGSASNPLSISDAQAILDVYGSEETRLPLYVSGVVTSNSAFSASNNFVWLQSDDGEVEQAFELFKVKLDSEIEEDYSAENSLVGLKVVAYGYGAIYTNNSGSKYELNTSNKEPNNPVIIEVVDNTVKYTVTFNSNGGSTIPSQTVVEGGVATQPSPAPTKEGYTFDGWYNESLTNEYNFSSPVTSDLTLYAKWTENVVPTTPEINVAGSFIKVTSSADLVDGEYLIVYEDGDNSVAFNGARETLDAVSNTIPVTINNNIITKDDDNKSAFFTIEAVKGGCYYIKSSSGQYIGRAANSNGLDSNATASDSCKNTIAITEGGAVITASGETTLRYNSASNQNRFRYYKSGQQPVQLYRFVPEFYEQLQSASGIKTIRGEAVVEDGQVTAVNSLTLRFGVKIPAENWNAIATLGYTISEYGIKMFLTNSIGNVSSVRSRGANVASVSANTTPYEDGQGNYNFMALVNIPNNSEDWPVNFSYNSYFCVRPYVVIDGMTFYLLNEDMHESVKTLAANNNGTNLSDKALEFLAA